MGRLNLALVQQFRVHKFIISYITSENTTMALGAHMCPYSYIYRIPSRDGALQNMSWFAFVLK